VYLDETWLLREHLFPLNDTARNLTLEVEYRPMALGQAPDPPIRPGSRSRRTPHPPPSLLSLDPPRAERSPISPGRLLNPSLDVDSPTDRDFRPAPGVWRMLRHFDEALKMLEGYVGVVGGWTGCMWVSCVGVGGGEWVG